MDGHWFYARCTSDQYPEVMVSVALGTNHHPTNPRPFRINLTSRKHILPREILTHFVDLLRTLGYDIMIIGDGHRSFEGLRGRRESVMVFADNTRGAYSISMTGSIEELHSILPTLQVLVHLEDGQTIELPSYLRTMYQLTLWIQIESKLLLPQTTRSH